MGNPRDNQHAFHHDDTAEMALARAEDHTHSAPRNLLEDLVVPETRVGVLFDLGEEGVETLASWVFIFGQPSLEQTPETKSAAHTERVLTMRALVRLVRDGRMRIS